MRRPLCRCRTIGGWVHNGPVRARVVLIVLVLLLLVGAGVALLLVSADPDGGGRGKVRPSLVEAPVPDEESDARRVRVSLPLGAATGGPSEPDNPNENLVPLVDAEPWPESGVEVDVVRASDGEPIPGIVVYAVVRSSRYWQTNESPSEGLWEMAYPHQTLRDVGKPYRADENGHVRLPAPGRMQHVWAGAELGDLVGQLGASAPFDGKPRTLEMVPRIAIDVHVIDSRGQPLVAFPLHLAESYAWGGTTHAITKTDQHGFARFPDLGDLRKWADDDEIVMFVRPAIPMNDPPRALLDVRDPPKEPLELVIPDLGSVRVKVAASDDEDERIDAPAYWRVLLDVVGEQTRFRDRERSLVASGELSGQVRYSFVGLGTRLRARLEDRWGEYASVSVEFEGPTTVGEEVTVELAWVGRRLEVTGRVIDGEGVGVPELMLSAGAKAQGDDPWMDGLSETDAKGRFEVVLDHSRSNLLDRRLVVNASQRVGRSGQNRKLYDEALPATLPEGPLDVGDLVLSDFPVLAAGRVVDREGRPIVGAVLGAIAVEGTHRSHVQEVSLTDDDGRFELRSEVSRPNVLVVPKADGIVLVSGADPVAVGSDQVEIVAVHGGTLSGKLLLPPDSKGEDFDVMVSGAPVAGIAWRYSRPQTERMARMWDDGRFEVTSLLNGTADVVVKFSGTDVVLASVAGVRVREGAETDDERLAAIDLREKLAPRSVRVVAADGSGISQAYVHFRLTGTSDEWLDARADQRGAVTVVAPPGALDVLALADGYRATFVAGASDGAVVKLERATPVDVEISLSPESAIPSGEHTLQVMLQYLGPLDGEPGDPDDDDFDWWDPRGQGHIEQILRRDRPVTFQVTEPGWWVVTVMEALETIRHSSMWTIEVAEGAERFRLEPGAGKKRIAVRVDADALESLK